MLLSISLLVSSCNPERRIQRRGGYMLTRNTVKTDNSYIPTEEIEGFVQQKATPGKIALRPGVWIYEGFSKGKQKKFKTKIREKYGTAPVILDSNQIINSELNIRLYLKNKGFYHPTISHRIKFSKLWKSRASVTYNIKAGTPCVVSGIHYSLPDAEIASFFYQDTSTSLLKLGMIYDTYRLDDERDRVSSALRQQGYFNFSKSNISYLVDTVNQKADVTLVIENLTKYSQSSSDSSSVSKIPRYFIRNLYIQPNFEQNSLSTVAQDTLVYTFGKNADGIDPQKFYFLQSGRSRLNPSVLSNTISLRTGQAYDQEMVTQSYKRLISLPVIRSANITLSPADSANTEGKRWLDCMVKLTRNPVNLLSLGTEGTNSAGSLGMGVNILYQNRNIFRRAETFRLKINSGAELQGTLSQSGNEKKLWVFNALESGIETGIDIPRLLLPFPILKPDRTQLTRTSITAGFGFETRPDYSRRISTFSGSYQWSSSPWFRHIFTPLELNFVRIEKDSAFNAYLNSLTDPQFIGQYNDHLLTMIRYSLIYSNQSEIKQKNLFFLRLNAETSGNMFRLLDQSGNQQLPEGGYYERFGVRYAQYIRFDVDYRKYWKQGDAQTLAFRIMGGSGIPYGNSDGIPFEKSFWLGGANDMRGWKLRSLGPGGFTNDSVRYDRTGDLMAYTSLEYRFPIYSFLNGGLFADAGNIWLRKENSDFPDGNIDFGHLGKQIALDAGFGFRFDFSFFIFRLDWALRLKNPQLESQWFQPEDFRLRKAVWNFGIGYPF
ncbi:MAG: BamA/TamA family outer membrane protein [Bacteroidales bacterium]|nr:BamA/TamA family outer membrane protein [Bacteroidales bacterium]